MTCMDQPSDAEWCTVTNRALSRSSNRHSSAFISGISRALIEPASTSWTSLAMTWSLEVPVTGGRSLTSSGTRHGGHTCWYGGSASLTTTVRSSSWRATTSSSDPCSTARSTGPLTRTAPTDMNREPNVPPSSPWSSVRNHSWVYDSGYRADFWSRAGEDSVTADSVMSATSLPGSLPCVSQLAEPAIHVTDRGRLEQVGHRHPDTQGSADPPGQHHGLQRPAAEIEEVAANPAPGRPQLLREQLAQQLLPGSRRHTRKQRAQVRHRSAAASTIPAAVTGISSTTTIAAGMPLYGSDFLAKACSPGTSKPGADGIT